MGEEKRIKDLAAASSITNNDYLAMDNANNSAAKKTSAMPLKNVQGSNDAYSSSKAYNVGDLVIYSNQLYRCNTACSAASWSTNRGYFDAVTLTDAVTQLNNDLTVIQQAISGLATASRKIIFIGDSYMTGEASGLPTITSFVNYFATYSGLTLGTDIFVSAHSGYGFKDNGFLTLLQNVSIGAISSDDITDIIVLGGINDANLISTNFSGFEQKIVDFVTYAKANYAKAKIRVGYISKDYQGRFLFNINGVAAYKCINRNGGFYLTGIENTLREIGHFRSDGHPSVDGQKVLGRALVDAVFYGSCSPAYASQPVGITAASNVTILANEIVAEASNGVVTISAHNWSKFSFPSRSFTSPTNPLYIGEMNSGLLIGESDVYKYIPVTMVLVGSPTNYQIEGKLLFSNKGVYAFPWQQLTVPSGITELRIAPFSFTLNSANI